MEIDYSFRPNDTIINPQGRGKQRQLKEHLAEISKVKQADGIHQEK